MVGNGREGGEEDGGRGKGAGDALQGNCSVGIVIWERYLGGDEGHAKSTRGIISSDSQTGCGDDGATYDERKVGVAPSG